MKLLKNLNISKKLLLLFIPSTVTLIILLSLFVYELTNINATTKKIYYQEAYVSTSLILNADRDFYQAFSEEKELVLSSSLDSDAKKALFDAYAENRTQLQDRMEQAIDNIKNNNYYLYKKFKHSTSGQTLETLYKDYLTHLDVWKSSYDVETLKGDYTAHMKAFDDAREPINGMTEILDQYTNLKAKSISNHIINTTIILSIIVIAVILFIALLAIYIIKYLKTGIMRTTKDMKLLSNNDLTFETYQLNSKDELGALSISVKSLIDSLKEIIKLLSLTSKDLSRSSSAMKLNSDEITISMNEIANTVGEISGCASQQAEEAEHAAQEFDNLATSLTKSNQSTKNLSLASINLNEISKQGLITITELADITEKNNKSFELIFNTIENTNESAGKISEVIETIANIAEQTNLLALNASIEAARAGESGKGFSVVADEIKKLADQSSHSTSSIKQILNSLQNQISDANGQSNSIKEAVSIQGKSVKETEERYKIIVKTLDDINNDIDTLETIGEEIEKSSDVVLDIITSLAAIAQENAASTQETTATTEEILASMLTINDATTEVNDKSIELNSVISKFKIEL